MPTTRWSACSYLSFDPGINVMGWAAFWLTHHDSFPEVLEYGKISPLGSSTEDSLRVACVVEQALAIATRFSPGFIFIEQPPSTVYGGSKSNKGALIARAQSVFKTVAVCFSLFTTLRLKTKTIPVMVQPSQWQPSKKARGGLNTKFWSLSHANRILGMYARDKSSVLLDTEENENVADAICLGFLSYPKRAP